MVRVHPGLLTEASRSRQLRVLLCLPEAQAGHTGPRRGARPSPPPCHGGDRGFESHRGRFAARGARYANRQSGEAQTFVTCGFDSHSCHYSQEIRVGWALARPSGCNPPACRQCRFDSCPTHSSVRQRAIGPFVYRHRTAAPQAAKAGSIPARVTHGGEKGISHLETRRTGGLTPAVRRELTTRTIAIGQVVQLVDTRRSERRALTGLGVRLSPWSLESHQQTKQGGQCPVEPHKLQAPGATPGPATGRRQRKTTTTTGYANRKSGGVESPVILWVRLPPRSIRLTAKVQSPRSKGRKHKTAADAFSLSFRLWTLDLGLWTLQPGLLVKREDAWLATRKSGFDSPAVHWVLCALHGARERKVAGYGWPGRSAKAVPPRADEGSNPLPSACFGNGGLDGETEIIPCF
jgi:hypothetical protein